MITIIYYHVHVHVPTCITITIICYHVHVHVPTCITITIIYYHVHVHVPQLCQSDPKITPGLTLPMYLITPVQRIPRYILLLKVSIEFISILHGYYLCPFN